MLLCDIGVLSLKDTFVIYLFSSVQSEYKMWRKKLIRDIYDGLAHLSFCLTCFLEQHLSWIMRNRLNTRNGGGITRRSLAT
jgi:hypothetical protein